MSDITLWSPIDEDDANKVAAPGGFPEPMLAGQVNNSARAIMGAVRRIAEDGGWLDWGHTITFVDANSFTVNPGENLGNTYQVDRRVRGIQQPSPTYTGTIIDYDSGTGLVTCVTENNDAFTANLNNAGNGIAVGVKPQATPVPPVLEGILPPGAILAYSVLNTTNLSGAPDGWLWCTGSSYNAGADPSLVPLWNIIGTTFGGTGINDFNVPDIRGRVVAGYHNTAPPSSRLSSGGVDAANFADTGGNDTQTLSASNLPNHTHNYERSVLGPTVAAGGSDISFGTGITSDTGSVGSGTGHNNVQPTIILSYIIKI